MAIDGLTPGFREVAASSAVPQPSLTRRERELQIEDGRPPIEVPEAEMEALRWLHGEDVGERPRSEKRRNRRGRQRRSSSGRRLEDAETQPELTEEFTEEETGTLFDDRS